MFEVMPDRPDWDEYEAEQERIHRHHKKMQREYERVEQENEDEFIRNRKRDYVMC